MHCTRDKKGNHKVELLDTGAMSYAAMHNEVERIFDLDAARLPVMCGECLLSGLLRICGLITSVGLQTSARQTQRNWSTRAWVRSTCRPTIWANARIAFGCTTSLLSITVSTRGSCASCLMRPSRRALRSCTAIRQMELLLVGSSDRSAEAVCLLSSRRSVV